MNITICKLIDGAVNEAGSRIPDDILVGQLADYVGLNPIDVILMCKLETESKG